MVIAMSSIALAAEDPVQPNAPRNNVSPAQQAPSWLGSSVWKECQGYPPDTALGAPQSLVRRGSSDSLRILLEQDILGGGRGPVYMAREKVA